MKKSAPNKSEKGILAKIQKTSIVISILILSVFNLLYFASNPKVKNVLGAQSNPYDTLISFWQDFLNDQPNYMDGWLRLAEIEYLNNNISQAKYYLSRATEIDPNSEKLLYLKNKIGD